MEIDVSKLSPMMQNYMATKDECPGCLLFYRLGDFYELFFDDAILASKELELTLTGKSCGLEERAPMCGVPFHAAESYINRLVARGYKVAICEQVEDPKLAKGLVKREIVRIVTPGTNLDSQALDAKKNNYIMCIISEGGAFGIASADLSTGEFIVTETDSREKLIDEIGKLAPAEIVGNASLFMCGIDADDIARRFSAVIYPLPEAVTDPEKCFSALLSHFKVKTAGALGLSEFDAGIRASGALLLYMSDLQKNDLSHITEIRPYRSEKFLVIDAQTRRNLELFETMREKQRRGTLIWAIDTTKTSMGGRLLRNFMEFPSIDASEIEERIDAVGEFRDNMIDREELREYLGEVYDLERLSARISCGTATPKDFIALKESLRMLPAIKQTAGLFSAGLTREITEAIDLLEDMFGLIDAAIDDEPPAVITDGGIIKQGYSDEIDKLRCAGSDGRKWIAEYEARERERTGIKNLRVKFSKAFGYCLEVTNSFKDLVPDYYTRRQTLTGAERYTTEELTSLEGTILGAEEKQKTLEYEIFRDVRDKVSAEVQRIRAAARAVAYLDVLSSLAKTAEQNRYVRPSINKGGRIDIKGGRHPVIEKMIGAENFVGNDTSLDNKDSRIDIITGPNMAGKSTYMRQTALIVLLAHTGSFVPADSADICITDRIFTRVGASDDLASGMSTFMVEMTEVATILRDATRDSLLILDEIGRGTGTLDGMSIAWAVLEYISEKIGAKALFATHYHELTGLEGKLSGVRNLSISVKEQGGDIVFLRKIIPGGTDKSYGVQVARLAGLPKEVIYRASEICKSLEISGVSGAVGGGFCKEAAEPEDFGQLVFGDTAADDEIIQEIRALDLGNMTPVAALNRLYDIQNRIKNRY